MLLWPMIIRNISGILWWYRLFRRIIVNVSCKTFEQFQKHYFVAIVHAFPVDHDLFTLIAEILNDNKDYDSFYFCLMLCIFDLDQVIFALQIKILDAFLWTQTLHFIYCTTPWKSLWKLGFLTFGPMVPWLIGISTSYFAIAVKKFFLVLCNIPIEPTCGELNLTHTIFIILFKDPKPATFPIWPFIISNIPINSYDNFSTNF